AYLPVEGTRKGTRSPEAGSVTLGERRAASKEACFDKQFSPELRSGHCRRICQEKIGILFKNTFDQNYTASVKAPLQFFCIFRPTPPPNRLTVVLQGERGVDEGGHGTAAWHPVTDTRGSTDDGTAHADETRWGSETFFLHQEGPAVLGALRVDSAPD